MTNILSRQIVLAMGCLGACFLLGCGRDGPEMAKVVGEVTFNGQPLEGATVAFAPIDGVRVASGITDEKGRYRLTTPPYGDGAVVGEHRVTVIARGPYKLPPEGTPGRGLPGGMVLMGDPLIPERYFQAATSGLTASVKSGRGNEIDFELNDAD